MARTTRQQIVGIFDLVRNQAVRVGVEDAQTWEIDRNSAYGGYRITSLNGSHNVTASRVPAGEFYRQLQALWYVLTDIRTEA